MKCQLTVAINFDSSKDKYDEECVMHLKSDSVEIMVNKKADAVVEKLFESLLKRYQNNLEESMKGKEFVFDFVHLLYYKCHKINSNCDGSHVDSPD